MLAEVIMNFPAAAQVPLATFAYEATAAKLKMLDFQVPQLTLHVLLTGTLRFLESIRARYTQVPSLSRSFFLLTSGILESRIHLAGWPPPLQSGS